MKINEKDDYSNIALIPVKDSNPIKLLNNKNKTSHPSQNKKDPPQISNRSTSSTISLPSNWKQNEINRITSSKGKISFTFISNKTNNIEYTAYKTGMFSYAIHSSLNNNQIAFISSNVLSNNFILYNNTKTPIMKMKYNLNILGMTGPSKMEVSLLNEHNSNDICIFCNKQPIYNVIYKCLVLKFIGRTIIRSAKNFQLVLKGENESDDVYFQFAKMDKDKYICDFKETFSDVCGFAIGIIALSQKMLCEQINDK